MRKGYTLKVITFILAFSLIIPLTFYSVGLTEEKKTEDVQKGDTEQTSKTSSVTKIEYDPGDRRDPFLSILALTRQKIEKRRKKSLNPLENFDITEFKLLGIVFDGKDYYASVLLPDGKAFTIKAGMTLGLYDGKVISINEESLTVREYVMNYKGNIIPKDTVLKLRKEEE